MSTSGVWYDCTYIILMAWHKSCTNVNTLAPGRPGCHFKTAIFNLVLLIDFFRSSDDNAPRWMPWDLTDDKSTSVQVMAWCHQATNHYLSQCWHRSLSPYGVTRPGWVNRPLENNQQHKLDTLKQRLACSGYVRLMTSQWTMQCIMGTSIYHTSVWKIIIYE